MATIFLKNHTPSTIVISAIVKIQESLPLLKSRKALSWILTIDDNYLEKRVKQARKLSAGLENHQQQMYLLQHFIY
jgi:hypothetical protein